MDLATAIEQLFGDVQTAAQIIAPLIAVIGFIGLGVMLRLTAFLLVIVLRMRPPLLLSQVENAKYCRITA